MNRHPNELAPEDLRPRFDPKQLPFKTTEELSSEEAVIGQERAVRAIDFGLNIQDHGYNVFVSGVPGTGKSSIVQSMIRRVAEKQPTPGDWCYVHNFLDPDRPKALGLPAGRGRDLQRDMARLIESLRKEFQKVFQSKEYLEQRRNLERESSKVRDNLIEQLDVQAKRDGFGIKSTKLGIAAVPLVDGKPLKPEEMDALDVRTRASIEEREKHFFKHIDTFNQRLHALREELNRKMEELDRQVARYSSEHFFDTLREKYRSFPEVVEYLRACREDSLENFKDFLPEEESPLKALGFDVEQGRRPMIRYAVNVIVDNSETKGAPIVEEINPTYNNLVGKIEKKGRLGTLYTDFTLIKAGAILQANGGYLLLNVLDVLRNPFSWEALKRVIKKQELKIEDIGELYGVISSSGIKPDPIPIKTRVVLIGNPYIYYLLHAYEEDFGEIYKVRVDFDTQKNLSDDLPMQYARFIAGFCRGEGLLHFDRGAVARVLEQTGRWAYHQKKLSLRFRDLADLVREADYWARKDGKKVVAEAHVSRAVEEKAFRSNLLEEYIRELIAEGTLMVDVEGAVVGQVNGLSVHDLGDFMFGRPSRISARIFLGEGGVVNIEREAKLSGRTHSKGVLILTGYLAGQYARDIPLSVSATLCFEQSYGEVEGDSASAAELIALLSGLSDVPIDQGIAVTGSVNQRGELQAVGGVNEKIEGFYGVCKAKGLTRKQGVVIPAGNVKNLVLKEEVVKAVASGDFHVYSVSTVDEAIEILTGRPAGKRQPDGTYVPDSINAAIMNRLTAIDEKLKERAGRPHPGPSDEEESEE